MSQISDLLDLLDTRSFSNLWFWLFVIAIWGDISRRVVGVPWDVIRRARAEPQGHGGLLLLDWLTLTLPRWQMGRTEALVLLGLAGFGLTSLVILGFVYGLEMAQAISLIGVPLALLFLLRLRLARRLLPMIADAHDGRLAPADAVTQALRRIVIHRRIATALSVLAGIVLAMWGSLWMLMHPNGL